MAKIVIECIFGHTVPRDVYEAAVRHVETSPVTFAFKKGLATATRTSIKDWSVVIEPRPMGLPKPPTPDELRKKHAENRDNNRAYFDFRRQRVQDHAAQGERSTVSRQAEITHDEEQAITDRVRAKKSAAARRRTAARREAAKSAASDGGTNTETP